MCKAFYLDVVTGNTVYRYLYQKANDMYKFPEERYLSMKLLDINHYIPLLCWTSKQHKWPYKFRFIAGASKCFNKKFAIDLSLALKCIKNQFKNYCKVIQNRTVIFYYWGLYNSYEFINKIADIKAAYSIKTFDFSTLYTN